MHKKTAKPKPKTETDEEGQKYMMVRIRRRTYVLLVKLGRYDETLDDIIYRVVEVYSEASDEAVERLMKHREAVAKEAKQKDA